MIQGSLSFVKFCIHFTIAVVEFLYLNSEFKYPMEQDCASQIHFYILISMPVHYHRTIIVQFCAKQTDISCSFKCLQHFSIKSMSIWLCLHRCDNLNNTDYVLSCLLMAMYSILYYTVLRSSLCYMRWFFFPQKCVWRRIPQKYRLVLLL